MDLNEYRPKSPFDNYDPKGDEYKNMMHFILNVETAQAHIVCPWLYELLQPKSIIDVGCGPGIYLIPFKERGCEVYGVDGCETGGECLDSKEFKRVDLRFPYAPKKRYDLALCLEVGEHLPEHYAPRLIDTLSDCSDVVFFSAAVPGQGGSFHMNEKPHSYWINLFKDRHNYVLHPLNGEMRNRLQTLDTPPHSGWLRNNSMLFIKE